MCDKFGSYTQELTFTRYHQTADDDIHVNLDGETADGEKAPSAKAEDGVLEIVQRSGGKNFLNQFALGKEGEVTLYVPDSLKGIVTIENGSGDLEIDSLVVSEFTLENSSGYVKLNHFHCC